MTKKHFHLFIYVFIYVCMYAFIYLYFFGNISRGQTHRPILTHDGPNDALSLKSRVCLLGVLETKINV